MSFGLQPSQVQGNPFLGRHLLRYPEERGLIVREIATPMPVDAESGQFYVVDFAYGRRNFSTRKAAGGVTPESTPPLSTGSYSTRNYSHKSVLLDRVRDNALKSPDGFKKIVDLYVRHPAMVVLLDLELDLINALLATGSYYSSDHYETLTDPTDQWDDFVNSNPQSDVIAKGEVIEGNSGLMLEELTLVLGRQVYHKLRQHPGVKANVVNVQAANPADINAQMLARYFGVKDVKIGGSLRVTSNIGSAQTVARNWGKNAFLVNIDTNPNSETGTSGSVVTAVTGGTQLPAEDSFRTDDPKATHYRAEAQAGITLGRQTGEGVRTMAAIFAAIS